MNEIILDAVNKSSHLGLWMAFYNEDGVNDRVIYTDELRGMLGYNKNELENTIEALAKIIHPDDAQSVFAAFAAAAADKTNRTKYDVD